MIVKCPHCGLEGKAEEEILDKKIRCPKCKEIFIAVDAGAETVVVTEASQEIEGAGLYDDPGSEDTVAETSPTETKTTEENSIEQESSSTELGETIYDEDIASLDDASEPVEGEELAEGVFRCVCCGFTFSDQYKQDSEQGPCCAACILTME